MNKKISFVVVLFLLFSALFVINIPICVYAEEDKETKESADTTENETLEATVDTKDYDNPNDFWEAFKKDYEEQTGKKDDRSYDELSDNEKQMVLLWMNAYNNDTDEGAKDSTDLLNEYGKMLPSAEEMFTESTIENILTSDNAEVIKPDFIYDSKLQNFVYKSGDNTLIVSNIPNDGMSTDAVYIKIDTKNVLVSLVDHDGEIVKFENSGYVDTPGRYTIYLACNQERTDEEGSALSLYCFSFYILPKYVNDLGVITVPEHFYIKDVLLSGEPLQPDGKYTRFLDKDGEYDITYCYDEDENMAIKLKFIKDTVAPGLTFDNGPEGGFTKGIVKYYPTEKNEKITVYYEGKEVVPENNELYISGRYRIIVSDEAGNVRDYKFVNKAEYHFFSKEIIIIGAIILISLFMFMVFNRRNNYGV